MNSFRRKTVAAVLVMVLAAPGWLLAAVAAPELPDPGRVSISKEEQSKLGLQFVGEVYKQMPVLPDSNPVTQYVQRLGQKLAGVIPPENSWPFQFHVVQQKEINAFAIPGGPVFVNLGTITAAKNEAQLAGVMAHEIAHVYMQHSVKQMQKQQLTQGLAGVLGGILGSAIGGTAGSLAQLGVGIGAGVISMKYSRSDEAQADAVGSVIMYKAGYNPVESANFFRVLEEQGGGGGPQFLSDHPNPGNRYEAIRQEVKNWPNRSYQTNSAQFKQAKQRAAAAKAYTAQEIAQMQKNGQIRNTSAPAGAGTQPATVGRISRSQIEPSGQFETLENQLFSMQHPANWRVVQGESGGSVTIAPEAGVAQNAVAYGVIVGSFSPQGGNSMEEATRQLVASIQQGNPGLKQVASSNVTVNRVQGRSVDLIGNSPVQEGNAPARERDWLVALPSGNQLVFIVFVAPEKDFSYLRPTFEDMLRSFHLRQ